MPKSKKKPRVKKAKKTTKKIKIPHIQKGYHAITPYLIVNNAHRAIEFYKKVFGAKQVMRMDSPNGKVSHAELQIGDAKIMLADECPERNAYSPNTTSRSPVGIHLYIKNADAIVTKAVAAGAILERPVETMFYGDRSGAIQDPFGHIWYVSTHVEHVTPAQIKKRMAAMFGKNK